MCGRFTYKFSWQEFHDRLKVFVNGLDYIGEGVENHPPRFNIAPTQPIIVISQVNGRHKASLMRWGLVPNWVKDPSKFALIINARMETILEKPSFRGSVRHHRCLIPASGYYEWCAGTDGKKQPFYITGQDGKPIVFAGVFSNWMGPDGEEVDTTAIITMPSSPDLKKIHNRMPAIIPEEMMADWLNVARVNERDAMAMLRAAPSGTYRIHPVSTRVNSNRNEGEDLAQPITLHEPVTDHATRKKSGQQELF